MQVKLRRVFVKIENRHKNFLEKYYFIIDMKTK